MEGCSHKEGKRRGWGGGRIESRKGKNKKDKEKRKENSCTSSRKRNGCSCQYIIFQKSLSIDLLALLWLIAYATMN